MGFFDELKRLARPYEDEEEDEEAFDDFEPATRSERMDRTERGARAAKGESTGAIFTGLGVAAVIAIVAAFCLHRNATLSRA